MYGLKIDKAKTVIDTINKLHYQGAVEDYVLANILENTSRLLECQISPEQYLDQSIAMLYSDNSGLRTLGLLMVLLAIAAASASILGLGIPLTVSVATSTTLLGLMGFGLFHFSKPQPLFAGSEQLLNPIQELANDPEQTMGQQEIIL